MPYTQAMTPKRFEHCMIAILTIAVVGLVCWGIASLAIGDEAGGIVLGVAYGADAVALIAAFLMPHRSRKPSRCYLP